MKKAFKILIGPIIILTLLACQLLFTAEQSYFLLRQQAINTPPKSLSIDIDNNNSRIPYGIVMDHNLGNEEYFTLVSFINGDCYILTSTGHNNLNAGSYDSVREASKKYVEVAARYINKMVPTKVFPLPKSDDQVTFYVLTPNGVYTTEKATWDELSQGKKGLFPLFLEMNKVIEAIRLSGEQ